MTTIKNVTTTIILYSAVVFVIGALALDIAMLIKYGFN
jgi:hypothetical protein